MIEYITGIITFILIVILLFTFLSYISLFLNLVILIALYFLITRDLKDTDNHKYYIVSLLLTALFFIFSTTGLISSFLGLTEKLLLSVVSVAALLVYLFANIVGFVYEYYRHLKEKHKR